MWSLLSKAQSGRKEKEGITMKLKDFIEQLKLDGFSPRTIDLVRRILVEIKKDHYCITDDDAFRILMRLVEWTHSLNKDWL